MGIAGVSVSHACIGADSWKGEESLLQDQVTPRKQDAVSPDASHGIGISWVLSEGWPIGHEGSFARPVACSTA